MENYGNNFKLILQTYPRYLLFYPTELQNRFIQNRFPSNKLKQEQLRNKKCFFCCSETIGSRNLFHYAIRSYINERKSIDNFNDNDLEEIIQSKNALKNAEALKNTNQDATKTNNIAENNPVQQKISMVDLETALSYMLRREIPRIKHIQGESYDALLHWLNVLVKV